jgi:hypothetical protein
MFRDTVTSFPNDKLILGRYLGPAIDTGSALTAKILKSNGVLIFSLVKSEWRRPLPYKCLYPCLYYEESEGDCYICAYDDKYIDALSKNKGWYDTEIINIFLRLACHVGYC